MDVDGDGLLSHLEVQFKPIFLLTPPSLLNRCVLLGRTVRQSMMTMIMTALTPLKASVCWAFCAWFVLFVSFSSHNQQTSVGGTEHEQVVPKAYDELRQLSEEWSAKEREDEVRTFLGLLLTCSPPCIRKLILREN